MGSELGQNSAVPNRWKVLTHGCGVPSLIQCTVSDLYLIVRLVGFASLILSSPDTRCRKVDCVREAHDEHDLTLEEMHSYFLGAYHSEFLGRYDLFRGSWICPSTATFNCHAFINIISRSFFCSLRRLCPCRFFFGHCHPCFSFQRRSNHCGRRARSRHRGTRFHVKKDI